MQVRIGVIDFNVQLAPLPGSANAIIDSGGVYLPVPWASRRNPAQA